MFRFTNKGNLDKTYLFLNKYKKGITDTSSIERICQEGVDALRKATPYDRGKTADSWSYKIERTNRGISINFLNSNIEQGVPIAIILQYGHGTGTGGWVQGRDYINPAIQPIFDKITNQLWMEVTRL